MSPVELFPTQTHTLKFAAPSLPLSCRSYLCQYICLRSWSQQFLAHSLVQAMHGEAWCASWGLTHSAVCCHHHSFLFLSERNSNKIIYTVISQADYHTSFSWRCRVGLCLSLLLNQHSPALSPLTSLHMFKPSFFTLPWSTLTPPTSWIFLFYFGPLRQGRHLLIFKSL